MKTKLSNANGLTATLRKVQRHTVTDDVESQLRDAILSGAIAPGESLAEAQLAKQFGVSRASVRQAKFQLSQEGLLEFDSRGTARVRMLTEQDVEDIVEFRELLDVAAMRLACRRLSNESLTRLRELTEQIEQAKDLLRVTVIDISFHEEIIRAAGNSRLLETWHLFRPQLHYWLAGMHRLHSTEVTLTQEETANSHRRLLNALEAGDADHCERLARQHASSLHSTLFGASASRQESRGEA